jgi:transcriptional regulator with PAS, ATPase and Fis domain
VAVNCAAIPPDLLEAELFGVHRGAATGVEARAGSFRRAAGGTLFLDEIGEMPQALQAKLLRALQEREIQPVGGDPETLDVRLVAATNRGLDELIGSGTFRSDLYYRLAGAVLEVPPLRHRTEDLPALAAAFVRRFRRPGDPPPRGITAKAMNLLLRHPWPGNVRELEHELRRALHRCAPGGAIDSTLFSPTLRAAATLPPVGSGGPWDLKEQVARLERRLIAEALAETGGNRSQAARRLGISRNTLGSKIELYALDS